MKAKYTWPFPTNERNPGFSWKCSSSVISSMVGILSKIWLCKMNNVVIHSKNRLYEAVLNRPRDTALITVSNHFSCIDDPLLWGCLSWKALLRPSTLRWSLAAHDICFTNRMYGMFFALGKVVPVVRGEGVYQKGMDFVLEKTKRGDWTHVFPEGRVNLEKTWIRLKWGVGRLVCECQTKVIVLPIYHIGMDDVLPNTRPYIPRRNKAVTIVVGTPLNFESNLFRWRELNWSVEMMRKAVTDKIQEELQKLREEAELLHQKRLKS